MVLFIISSIYDIVWVYILWGSWWNLNKADGPIWTQLSQLHSSTILLVIGGVLFKICASVSLYLSKDLASHPHEEYLISEFGMDDDDDQYKKSDPLDEDESDASDDDNDEDKDSNIKSDLDSRPEPKDNKPVL